MTEPKKPNWRLETVAVHGGYRPDPTTRAVAVPIYQTVAYAFDDTQHGADLFDLKVPGNIYTRIMNPTTDVLEQRVAALEGGIAALALASGQSAVTYAILTIAEAGDNIISSSTLYGGTYNLFAHTLPQYGITTRFANPSDLAAFEAQIDDRTKAIFAESVGNPLGNITDIAALADVAHRHGLPLIVDNTVPSPYLLRPIEHGADIVVHAATKYLGGHGTSIAGVIVDAGSFDYAKEPERFPGFNTPDESYHGLVYARDLGVGSPVGANLAYILKARVQLLRDLGPAISPFNAFLIGQGVETLSLRIERHIANTHKVAEYLQGHAGVESVRWASLPDDPSYAKASKYVPAGAGAVISFEIKGGLEAGKKFVEALTLHSHLANIGDVRSLVIHPASTTHSQGPEEDRLAAGVTPGLVRLAVGIEHIDDIIADLEQGFTAAKTD